MNSYVEVIKKYIVFKGRARRKEYWPFILINAVISGIFRFVDTNLFKVQSLGILSILYNLFIFLPLSSVCIRRLHDIGKSGMLYWIYLVITSITSLLILVISFGYLFRDFTIIALIISVIFLIIICTWFFILMIKDSQPGENKYGPNPKEVSTINNTSE